MPVNPHNPFRGRQYPGEVIVLCVRWYLRHPLSYEHVTELVAERGVGGWRADEFHLASARSVSVKTITALRANTFTPCTPNCHAAFSLDVARKQSNRPVMCTSSKPIRFRYATSSTSGRAPAIQPVHKSILRRIF